MLYKCIGRYFLLVSVRALTAAKIPVGSVVGSAVGVVLGSAVGISVGSVVGISEH